VVAQGGKSGEAAGLGRLDTEAHFWLRVKETALCLLRGSNVLPPIQDLETQMVLKKLPAAHRALAELKGILGTIANAEFLFYTVI
jgi:hypothetical protein